MEYLTTNHLLNSLNDAILFVNREMVVEFCNRAASCLIGKDSSSVTGCRLNDLLPGAAGESIEKSCLRAVENGSYSVFHSAADCNDSEGSFDVHIHPSEKGYCISLRQASRTGYSEKNLANIAACLNSMDSSYSGSVNALMSLAGEILEADFCVYKVIQGLTLKSAGSWGTLKGNAGAMSQYNLISSDFISRPEQEHLFIPDVSISSYARKSPAFRDLPFNTYLGHIVGIGNARHGVLCCYYSQKFSPSKEQLDILKIISATLGRIEATQEKEQLLINSNKLLQDALEHLNDAQEEIVKRERLSALGQMVSGIAHDFNNALMPVMGISDLIIRHPETLDDRVQILKDMEMIRHSAGIAAQTVRSLREFYRPASHDEFTGVNIPEIIRATVKSTEHAWKVRAMAEERPIEMRVMTGHIPETYGNMNALEDVISNLILNSVDAMPHGGIITIRAWFEDNSINISVHDNGTGMPEDVRAHCLEPFFTTKLATGTGMGLSRSYGIISRHGGTMTVESELGKGTEVIIKLLHRPPPDQSQSLRKNEENKETGGILVVDDDSRTRYLLEKYLSGLSRSITVCSSGREALSKFNPEKHSLLITDKAMPEMEGDELASEIRKISRAVQVIMLTGYGELAEEPDPSCGVDRLLSKPITRQDLIDAINTLEGKA